MAKQSASFPLVLPAREAGAPATRWLVGALCDEIVAGRLRPGARLPATRDLAQQYGLSRGTVVAAYERLASEGYLDARTGAGTFVNRVLPDSFFEAESRASAPRQGTAAVDRGTSRFAGRVREIPGYELRTMRAFRANLPALDLFPVATWAQVAGRRLRSATPFQLLGCDTLGHGPLREVVADYLVTSRGARCSRAQVVIVSGLQEALDLVAQVLLNEGDRVCVEDPGYDGAVRVFEALGARLLSTPVDAEGMVVPASRDVRLAYVTPGHQFPLGISMSLRRRMALLEWARSTGALILEDDYDSEFRYVGRPLPALQGLDDSVVLLAGSFSKVLFPSLRLGYVVVPERLIDAFSAVKSVTTRHAPVLDQVVLCDFITGGHFGRHIRRMREVYAERLGCLVDAATRHLAGALDIAAVEAGLQTAGMLQPGVDAEAVACAAARQQVEVSPLSRYAHNAMPRDGLQLGFAPVGPKEIRRGVEVLAGILT